MSKNGNANLNRNNNKSNNTSSNTSRIQSASSDDAFSNTLGSNINDPKYKIVQSKNKRTLSTDNNSSLQLNKKNNNKLIFASTNRYAILDNEKNISFNKTNNT